MYAHTPLEQKLEELLLEGQTFITWHQIKIWWMSSRIAKTPYRDIQRAWLKMCEEQGIDPAPQLEVRGTGGRAATGGVRLVRGHLERFDGTSISLEELAD